MTRPQRHKKGDRLTYPGASAEEIACDFALAPFDRTAVEMERAWGVDRLPALVAPTLAEKYGRALAHLNACIDARDPAAVAAAAENCVKGLRAMDEHARQAGHKPTPPDMWEITVDGTPGILIRDMEQWPAAQAARPGLRIWSIREVEIALASYGQIVAAAKDAFPGAEVRPPRSPLAESINDEIPY